jgi:hypothetical protein
MFIGFSPSFSPAIIDYLIFFCLARNVCRHDKIRTSIKGGILVMGQITPSTRTKSSGVLNGETPQPQILTSFSGKGLNRGEQDNDPLVGEHIRA